MLRKVDKKKLHITIRVLQTNLSTMESDTTQRTTSVIINEVYVASTKIKKHHKEVPAQEFAASF